MRLRAAGTRLQERGCACSCSTAALCAGSDCALAPPRATIGPRGGGGAPTGARALVLLLLQSGWRMLWTGRHLLGLFQPPRPGKPTTAGSPQGLGQLNPRQTSRGVLQTVGSWLRKPPELAWDQRDGEEGGWLFCSAFVMHAFQVGAPGDKRRRLWQEL